MMRRLMVLLPLTLAISVLGSNATASSTLSYQAVFKGEFPGASPEAVCPSDPSSLDCAVGNVAGFGPAANTFEGESVTPLGNGCILEVGTATTSLLDGSGTLITHEIYPLCWPGSSNAAPGNRFHSFGNPFSAAGTFEVVSGSGVFAGATGGGSLTIKSGGDAIVVKYDGRLTLP
jgi:hypothetical protein